MPNFPPLRRYVHAVVDRWIGTRGLAPPFLEVGCGTGELAAHLAGRGWAGTVLDSSPPALARARVRLAAWPGVTVADVGLDGLGAPRFRTAFMMDVIEHVRDDEALLRAVAERIEPGGWLVLLTPVNPPEWRQDDVLYGHYRRYTWDELDGKLERAGFAVADRWNVTVPFMWFLRRLYLKLLPVRPEDAEKEELTAASSIYNPWDARGVLRAAGRVLGWRVWWAPLFAIQTLFRHSRAGHAAMVLARRSPAAAR